MHDEEKSYKSTFGIAWNSVLALLIVAVVLIVVILFIVFTAHPAQDQAMQLIRGVISG